MNKVNIAEKFALIKDHYNPRVAGELNGQMVKLVKFKGAFPFHFHEHEDELFLCIKGSFVMDFKDKSVTINEGEFIIVPRGVEHRPNAAEEVEVLLFEPATTLNTGNVNHALTRKTLEQI